MRTSSAIIVAAVLFTASIAALIAYEELQTRRALALLDQAFGAVDDAVQQPLQAFTTSVAAQARAARIRRSESATGRDLMRRCNEYRAAHTLNGGAYAREQMQRACRRYSLYVETGTVGR